MLPGSPHGAHFHAVEAFQGALRVRRLAPGAWCRCRTYVAPPGERPLHGCHGPSRTCRGCCRQVVETGQDTPLPPVHCPSPSRPTTMPYRTAFHYPQPRFTCAVALRHVHLGSGGHSALHSCGSVWVHRHRMALSKSVKSPLICICWFVTAPRQLLLACYIEGLKDSVHPPPAEETQCLPAASRQRCW